MKIYVLTCLLFLLFACTNTRDTTSTDSENNYPSAILNIATPPVTSISDEAFANIYQALDGKWSGTFKIYKDLVAAKSSRRGQLDTIGINDLRKPSLLLQSTVQVEQEYRSETPYFQRVTITDRYQEKDGTARVVQSKGVNKVQNGQLWCVVEKPDERIVHQGTAPNPTTIIWQRAEKNPQKVEYFKETIENGVYEITGYAYYEDDDLNKMPTYWFYGRYEKQL